MESEAIEMASYGREVETEKAFLVESANSAEKTPRLSARLSAGILFASRAPSDTECRHFADKLTVEMFRTSEAA